MFCKITVIPESGVKGIIHYMQPGWKVNTSKSLKRDYILVYKISSRALTKRALHFSFFGSTFLERSPKLGQILSSSPYKSHDYHLEKIVGKNCHLHGRYKATTRTSSYCYTATIRTAVFEFGKIPVGLRCPVMRQANRAKYL